MKKGIVTILVFILFYTRFIGITWGLPYHMHPDERNMAVAVTGLRCERENGFIEIKDCMNPRFYAYGQMPLYAAYALIKASHLISFQPFSTITMEESILALRFISAICSLAILVVMLKILQLLFRNKLSFWQKTITSAIYALSPYTIQFSHFGTTESLLMLSYTYLVYLSLRLMEKEKTYKFYALTGLAFGITVGVKLSALLFGAVPFLVWFNKTIKKTLKAWTSYQIKTKTFKNYRKMGLILRQVRRKFAVLASTLIQETRALITAGFVLLGFCLLGYVISSPHNIINFQEFVGSMRYESGVATGAIRVFYTRQFEHSIPALFQLVKIFPYAFGFIGFAVFLFGFFLLDWSNKQINLIRFAILVFFLPSAFLYAKWTRFISPVFPLMTILIILSIISFQRSIKRITLFVLLLILVIILPGMAYLSIYTSRDVRFRASEYFYKNVDSGKQLFYETANVVDIPIPDQYALKNIGAQRERDRYNKQYVSVSFNFYDVDQESYLKDRFWNEIERADYILIPSRRVFKNHVCVTHCKEKDITCRNIENIKMVLEGYMPDRCNSLKQKYPLLHEYYAKLWSGALGFEKVAEYSSFPRITIFGKTLFEMRDESAEETWTVFDHPVIRIYKKTKS